MDFVGAMHFGSEWSITKLYNMNSCNGMQCMAVDEQYLYNVKVNSFTEADAFIARTGNVYTTAVAGIAAKNLSDTLYVAAVYSDGAQSHCSGVLAYSIGEYCRTQIPAGTEAMQQLAKATAVYGYYAKCYLSENS